MKNKLLTSALISSMFGLGISSALAQTTVSGNLNVAYHAVSSKNANATTGGSYRAIGQETQINIQTKGKLSNGMDYAAGFSWEIDGDEALGGDSSAGAVSTNSTNGKQENGYIDLYLSKDTYISFSSDHIPNTDVTMTNLVGWGYLGGQGINNNGSSYPTSLNDAGYGIGVVHNFGPALISIAYQPSPGKATGASDTGHNIKSQQDNDENAKWEAIIRGDLGIKGLDVLVGMQRQAARLSTGNDENGRRVAAKYNFGQITVAGDYIKLEGQDRTIAGTAQTTRVETLTGKSLGVAFAATKDLSLGVTRSVGKTSASGLEDEKVTMYALGYNLGPVAFQTQLRKVDNAAGTNTADGTILQAMLSTKF